MGPFKTVGGLHASGWQIAIFYKGPAITETWVVRMKSRLGTSGERWRLVLEHRCARLSLVSSQFPLDLFIGVSLSYQCSLLHLLLSLPGILQKPCREKLGHGVNITHLTNSKFAGKRQLLRLTFAKWLTPPCGEGVHLLPTVINCVTKYIRKGSEGIPVRIH